jgi:hypothetical protein
MEYNRSLPMFIPSFKQADRNWPDVSRRWPSAVSHEQLTELLFGEKAPTNDVESIREDWGRPNQSTRTLTFFSDFTESRSVAELEFAFRPAE